MKNEQITKRLSGDELDALLRAELENSDPAAALALLEELERRLRGRGDTPEEQIEVRMARAKWEIAQSDHYDYVVLNDGLDRCVAEILDIITGKEGSR